MVGFVFFAFIQRIYDIYGGTNGSMDPKVVVLRHKDLDSRLIPVG